MAVAVFNTNLIVGHAVAKQRNSSIILDVEFTRLPPGKHGFHIHTAGDLRGEGCQGACSHWHKGSPKDHGDYKKGHTGDLGNIELIGGIFKHSYTIPNCHVAELWGRTLIIHADADDLGLGNHDDSKTTGHSGARIGCAIFGRSADCNAPRRKTRKSRT
jgi:Cu-Zn family superoxide dismutase